MLYDFNSGMSDRSKTTPQTTPPPAPVLTPEEASARLSMTRSSPPIRDIVATAGITRRCETADDLTFATLCVLRVPYPSKTGRDFLQTHGIPLLPGPHPWQLLQEPQEQPSPP